MDLSRQLKTAIKNGDLTFGQNQASNACANGQAKMLIFAAISFRVVLIVNCLSCSRHRRDESFVIEKNGNRECFLGLECSTLFHHARVCYSDFYLT